MPNPSTYCKDSG